MFLGYARVVSVLKVCPIEFSMVKCFISVITKTNAKRKTGQHLIAWHSNQIEIDHLFGEYGTVGIIAIKNNSLY